MSRPSTVTLVEVGPRDGLQNETSPISTDDKVAFVDALSAAGHRVIEVSSFVSPKWVPQMADAAEVFARITRRPGVRYTALVPNLAGLERALAARADEIAVFAAASETFSRRNINATIDDALARYAEVVRAARAVYLVGDQPLHLRSVLKDTPLWHAIVDVLAAGGLVVGVGACASALCDPMVDPRGGAFTLGLGMVTGLGVVHAVEGWSAERLQRTLRMADTTVACLPTGGALVRRDSTWETVGDIDLHGELP